MIEQDLHHCTWFDNMLARVGEKGISVIALAKEEHRSFYLETRPFDTDVVKKYSSKDPVTGLTKWPALEDSKGGPAPYATSMIVPLQFCPSCGADLAKIVRKRPREFDALARSILELHPEARLY